MDVQLRERIKIYVENQLRLAGVKLKDQTFDYRGNPYLRRSAVLALQKYVRDFTKFGSEPRWIAVPGLRGVGKTTLLAQIYTELQCDKNCKIYISLDELSRVIGGNLKDMLTIYEEIIGKKFEELDRKVYLFIDEVQYEENWGLILKSIYDRSKNIFIFCTGSSALSLQSNPDISRRLVFNKLFPMSFTEFMMLKKRKLPIKGLGNSIREVLLNSKNANEVHSGLLGLKNQVIKYWSDNIGKVELDEYLRYGTLPFALQYSREGQVYNQIDQMLTSIINKDIPRIVKFDRDTINKMQQILYSVSSNSITSLTSLSTKFKLSINTLVDIFQIFEKSEVLLRIYPYGSHYGQTRKPSKYLFLSSAYRNMFFNLIGSSFVFDNYKGQLLEDIVGLYLYRLFGLKFGSSLTYDSSEGGADFIISAGSKKIIIEVGYGNKGFRQINSTMKRVPGAYGLSVCSSKEITLDKDNKSVIVPLSYFLLI